MESSGTPKHIGLHGRLEHRQLASLLPFGEPIAVCRGHPSAHAAFPIWDVGLLSTGTLGCRELRHRLSPALKQHGGPDQHSKGDERCGGESDNRPEAAMARKGRVGAHVEFPLRWAAWHVADRMRPTLPSAGIFSPSADLKRSETRRSHAPKCPERRDGTGRSVVGVGSGVADRHNPTVVESADELTLPGGALCGSETPVA